MAPLGLMSREYLDELGGVDRRYICGQYENDWVMRVYADGGEVIIFGDKDNYINIPHQEKSKLIKESTDFATYQQRPFAKGYVSDRVVLEKSWSRDKIVTLERYDEFEPFEDEDILIKSQSKNLEGMWV
jgi:hypothetical protein